MDNVTHTLVGVVMANAFFRKRIGKPAVPILALANNLPDIDAAVVLTGDPTAILMRRTFGHSLLLLPIWVFILSAILRRFYPQLRWPTVIGLTLLGALVHLFFDLINSFGVVLFWPWRDWRPELGIVFIIDLILTGLLAMPLLLVRLRRFKESLIGLSQISAAMVLLYLAFCGWSRLRAQEIVNAAAGTPVDFSYVFPEPLGPHRWRGVTREGKQYRIYLVHPWTAGIDLREEVVTEVGHPVVEEARRTPLAHRLEWFFKAPVWNLTEQTAEAIVYDLRFRTLVLPRMTPFIFRFPVGQERTALPTATPLRSP
ncbi:MAG: metal-dependent hydrolase [Nitrospirae bacterium]|nr:metal-dependent hydrolase [Candidatus Manganitrophaceae bacterium]